MACKGLWLTREKFFFVFTKTSIIQTTTQDVLSKSVTITVDHLQCENYTIRTGDPSRRTDGWYSSPLHLLLTTE